MSKMFCCQSNTQLVGSWILLFFPWRCHLLCSLLTLMAVAQWHFALPNAAGTHGIIRQAKMKQDWNVNVHEIRVTCCLDKVLVVDSENQVHALGEDIGTAGWGRGYLACIFFSYNLAPFLIFECWKWQNSRPHITVSLIPRCVFWMDRVLSEYAGQTYKGSCLPAYFVMTVFFPLCIWAMHPLAFRYTQQAARVDLPASYGGDFCVILNQEPTPCVGIHAFVFTQKLLCSVWAFWLIAFWPVTKVLSL